MNGDRLGQTRPCEYLGNEDDRWARSSIPWPGHRCHVGGKPGEIARVQQGLFCLTSNHANCPSFVLAKGLLDAAEAELPPPPLSAPPRRTLRSLLPGSGALIRIGLIASIVLFVIALDGSILRPFGQTAARSASVSTPASTVTTYTLFPPTRTPPQAPAPISTPSPPLPTPTIIPPTPAPRFDPPPADGQARIAMVPGSGPRGSRVTVTGTGWSPQAELAVRWGRAASEEGVVELVRTRTGETGSFTGSVLLPRDLGGTIWVSIRQGDRAAYVPFSVAD
ncbi:MAG: hypothetical protein U0556_19205 [Dehalococcoidia bacterium]